jgi:hypothetical protein
MAYRSLPKFDPSATFLATARLPAFNGVRFQPGEAMPSPPQEPGPRRVYLRQLRQLFELRKVDQVEPPVTPQIKNRKEKLHGRTKV